jgi:peptidoglycan hydrolase CwlO-like protein
VSSLSEMFRDWLVGDGFARTIARVAGLEVLIAEESKRMEQITQSLDALRTQGGQVAEVAQGLHALADANHEAFTSIEQQLATLNQQVADLRAGAIDPATVATAIDDATSGIQASINDARTSMAEIAADVVAATTPAGPPTPPPAEPAI